MSGIAGVLSSTNQQLVSKILDNITHQGTSSPKIWKNPNADLGAIGLSSFNEEPVPVTTPSGKRAIMMGGACVNRSALKELSGKHLRFPPT